MTPRSLEYGHMPCSNVPNMLAHWQFLRDAAAARIPARDCTSSFVGEQTRLPSLFFAESVKHRVKLCAVPDTRMLTPVDSDG